MVLTKKQIQHINRHLIAKGIKFWDVRLELIDHFASSIESSMNTQKLDFNNALENVHLSFGEKGYRLFLKQKQKQILRETVKNLYRLILKNFGSAVFIIYYAVAIGAILGLLQLGLDKWALIFPIVIATAFQILKIKTFTKKGTNHALRLNMLLLGDALILPLWMGFLTHAKDLPFLTDHLTRVYALISLLILPYLYSSHMLFIKTAKKEIRTYNLQETT